MSTEACAALVEKADPDRFRSVMVAPVRARPTLFALYAFNVEVARAPWVTQEPMIAEMRLQWWRDALDEIAAGGTVRRHEVVDALAAVLDADGARCLDALVAARRWDIYADAFEGPDHMDDYIDATSGHLMWTAARLLGAADEATVRAFARGAGIARLFEAVPDLEDRGRKPLVDGSVAGVTALAQDGLAALKTARAGRRQISTSAAPALLAGWAAAPVLRKVARTPAVVASGGLERSPLRDAARLAVVSWRGWWASA